MNINDQVMKEFQSFGYEDAKLGRKLTDADYFILSEAKRIVQTQFGEINNDNQKKLDEIYEAVNSLNNEVADLEEDIDSLKRLMKVDRSVEVENIFGTLLYHYEKGYLTYKYEKGQDKNSIPEDINYSDLIKDMIDQYNKNLEFGIDNLN